MLPAPPTEKDLEKVKPPDGPPPPPAGFRNSPDDPEPAPAEPEVFSMAAVAAVDLCPTTGGVRVASRLHALPLDGVLPLGVDVVISRQLALAEDELRRGSDTVDQREGRG